MAKTSGYVAKKQKIKQVQRSEFAASSITTQAGIYQNLLSPATITLEKAANVKVEINLYIDHYGGLSSSDSLLAANVNGVHYELMYNNSQDKSGIHHIKMNGSISIDLPVGVHSFAPAIFLQGVSPSNLGNFAYQFVGFRVSYLD